ncbi:MAG: hypothetical protein KGI54_08770 [Pseudomonadota bacterium]|nr:hypothetical protein [Pseudomonadota bacterium]
MRQLLRDGEWNCHALAMEADCHHTGAYALIQRELAAGNVAEVGYVVKGMARYKTYIWAGDDDLITMSIRAAEYLKEHAKDHLGQSLANHLMRLTGASIKP